MLRYYLIYGWELRTRKIIHPIIKEVNDNNIYFDLPSVTGYKFAKCYCSTDKKEIEEWFERTCEPFEKTNISYLNETIKNIEKLCRLQEERIANESWKEAKWPEDDLPF